MIKQPLSFRMRPTKIDDVVGQQHLVGENGFIRKCIENNTLFSMILFGPPGVGKTTIATIIANELNQRYRTLNATSSNKKDLEVIFEEAKMYGHMIVIIDEIHRLNKDKQDLLLPNIESGLVTVIGATTANPYHSINPAIRSRCHLLELFPLTVENIIEYLKKAIVDPRGLNNEYEVDEEVFEILAKKSGGDIRYALNNLDVCALASKPSNKITLDIVKQNIRVPQYLIDKDEDGHYDAVSALQKSIRGSDVNASLYYLARLLAAGDLESIERRLLVIAYEDIGLGNPQAVQRTATAIESAKKIGLPEAIIPLGVAVVDLALSPKSKSGYEAINSALNYVQNSKHEVPKFLRLTPHNLSEEDSYSYELKEIWDKIQYLPKEMKDIEFYHGCPSGSYEKALIDNYERLKRNIRTQDIAKLKKEINK